VRGARDPGCHDWISEVLGVARGELVALRDYAHASLLTPFLRRPGVDLDV
jgi:hypothetical protein